MYTDNSEYLCHYGIPGMHWGQRNASLRNERHTQRLAAKDAKRYADAKMFYGETAGTKRKLLNAELNKKKSKVPGYEEAFNKALENVDYAKSAKKAVAKRTTIDTTHRAKVTVKKILGITGPIAATAAAVLYSKNKDKVDSFVMSKGTMAFNTIKNFVKK